MSVAGIFSSNLGGAPSKMLPGKSDQLEFEKALGRKVNDLFHCYELLENESKVTMYRMLGIDQYAAYKLSVAP